MIATLEQMELLNYAEELARKITKSTIADEYRRALHILKQSNEAQLLITKFVSLKEQYEDVQRFGKYHPDYKEITTAIRRIKRELDLHETIINFKRAEVVLQQSFDEISCILGESISKHVKIPTGNSFFSSCGSSGGCGTGGSCGCK